MLKIQNLWVFVGKKEIVKDVSLFIKRGELHVLMGPNGSGKSSLAYALMGNPNYQIRNPKSKAENESQTPNSKPQIKLDGKNITELKPDERAKLGLFLAFQNPVAVPGVRVGNFLRKAILKRLNRQTIDILKFNKMLEKSCRDLGIKEEFLKRSLNDDFSGGEKKKIEALQMMVLKPKYAIIDEIDTGLDIDALKIVARAIEKLQKRGVGILLITHYRRILNYLKADFVHIMIGGRIIKSGKAKLAREIDQKGYQSLLK